MKKILIYALSIAVLAIVVEFIAIGNLSHEKARYEANQTALLADVEHYKTQSGKNAASVQKLTLTNAELKKNYDEVCKTAKDLRIEVKQLQSVTNTSTENNVEIKTVVKDSIVYVKGEPIKALAFDWKDPWTDVEGIIHNDSVNLNIQSTDTLVQFVHRVPHKFLFFKWGCKAIRQEIVSKNPHTDITYTEYIELK